MPERGAVAAAGIQVRRVGDSDQGRILGIEVRREEEVDRLAPQPPEAVEAGLVQGLAPDHRHVASGDKVHQGLGLRLIQRAGKVNSFNFDAE